MLVTNLAGQHCIEIVTNLWLFLYPYLITWVCLLTEPPQAASRSSIYAYRGPQLQVGLSPHAFLFPCLHRPDAAGAADHVGRHWAEPAQAVALQVHSRWGAVRRRLAWLSRREGFDRKMVRIDRCGRCRTRTV